MISFSRPHLLLEERPLGRQAEVCSVLLLEVDDGIGVAAYLRVAAVEAADGGTGQGSPGMVSIRIGPTSMTFISVAGSGCCSHRGARRGRS